MIIYSYASLGYEGELVTVEVDLRPALPGFEIVGLPDSAIREAKERIRVAIRNSGFEYPTKRILVNLYPAGIPKAGASFDLPIALGILAASGVFKDPPAKILAMGELQLSGRIRPADGVIAALHESGVLGNLPRLVPEENRIEAASRRHGLYPGGTLTEPCGCTSHRRSAGRSTLRRGVCSAWRSLARFRRYGRQRTTCPGYADCSCGRAQYAPLWSTGVRKNHGRPEASFDSSRSGPAAGAGGYPDLLGGWETPPGIRPYPQTAFQKAPSQRQQRRTHRRRVPFCSRERSLWLINGVLLLDEAGEFQPRVLQALREPAEQRRVDLVRAGRRAFYPARFQLIVTLNPCPCGNLGKEDAVCLCSEREIHRYWKTLGGALLDRMDIRLPLVPLDGESLMTMDGTTSAQASCRSRAGAQLRPEKTRGNTPVNSELSGKELKEAASLNENVRRALLGPGTAVPVCRTARFTAYCG